MKIAHERLQAGKRKHSTELSLEGYMQGQKNGIKNFIPNKSSYKKRKNLPLIKHILKSHRPCLSLKNKTS